MRYLKHLKSQNSVFSLDVPLLAEYNIGKGVMQMREYMRLQRLKIGLKQTEVAEAAGISKSYYSDIERGNRQKNIDITMLAKLAVPLRLTISDMIEFEERGKENGN